MESRCDLGWRAVRLARHLGDPLEEFLPGIGLAVVEGILENGKHGTNVRHGLGQVQAFVEGGAFEKWGLWRGLRLVNSGSILPGQLLGGGNEEPFPQGEDGGMDGPLGLAISR